jgi:hypothetical protein
LTDCAHACNLHGIGGTGHNFGQLTVKGKSTMKMIIGFLGAHALMQAATEGTITGTSGSVSPSEIVSPATGDVADAITLGSDLLVIARDQLNTGSVLIGMTPDERAAIASFVNKVKQQAEGVITLKAKIKEASKARNAGRPKRVRKTKDTPAPAANSGTDPNATGTAATGKKGSK